MFPETRAHADSYRGMQILNILNFDLKAQISKDEINYTQLEFCLIDHIVSRRPHKRVEPSALAEVFIDNKCPMSTKVYLTQYFGMILAHPS